MTAPSSDLRAWLAQLADTHAAASPGEWVADVPGMIHNNPVGRVKGGYIASVEHPENAAAIVAEHNATPALIAAVRGVLALADHWDDFAATRLTGLDARHMRAAASDVRSRVAAAIEGAGQ